MNEREITALILSLAPADLPPLEHTPADLWDTFAGHRDA